MENKNTSQILEVKRIGGSNLVQLTFPQGRAYYSYSEPVVIEVWGRCFATDESFSVTTSRHVGNITKVWGEKAYKIPHKYICLLVDYLCGKNSWVHHTPIKDTIWKFLEDSKKPGQVSS